MSDDLKSKNDILKLDEHGSIIKLKKNRTWFVGFVPPIKSQWWHRFFHGKHKHCFAIRKNDDGSGQWTLFEPWWTRLMVATVDSDKANQFLTWAKRGDLLEVTENVPGSSSQIRGWMTCAALCAHLLGRSHMVWTPNQLYRRLKKEKRTKVVSIAEINKLMEA